MSARGELSSTRSRRQFLIAGALVVAVLAASCGKSEKQSAVGSFPLALGVDTDSIGVAAAQPFWAKVAGVVGKIDPNLAQLWGNGFRNLRGRFGEASKSDKHSGSTIATGGGGIAGTASAEITGLQVQYYGVGADTAGISGGAPTLSRTAVITYQPGFGLDDQSSPITDLAALWTSKDNENSNAIGAEAATLAAIKFRRKTRLLATGSATYLITIGNTSSADSLSATDEEVFTNLY